MLKRTAVLAMVAAVVGANAQMFNDFEAGTVGSAYGFQPPNFSGSTSGNMAATPNIHDVVAGWSGNTTQVGHFGFAFIDAQTTRWVRITTFNAPGLPNPTVDLTQFLVFDIFSTVDLQLAVGIRETGSNVAVGANGGSANGIEWVSNAPLNASGAPGGQIITAGSWHTVAINLAAPPFIRPFAGSTADGILSAANNRGVLEHLAVTSLGNAGPYDVYVDNFQMSPVPEPGTMAALGLGAIALAFRRRRR